MEKRTVKLVFGKGELDALFAFIAECVLDYGFKEGLINDRKAYEQRSLQNALPED